MKKILGIILALIMLLCACAMAEGTEVTIGNVVYSDNAGNSIDLSGIELKFAAAMDETQGGVSVAVAANGEDVVRAVLSLDEAGAYLSANGISDVYALNMEAISEMMGMYVDQAVAEDSADQLAGMAEEAAGKLMAIMEESLTEAGSQNIDGVEYQVYNLYISGEQVKEIYGVIDQFLALYPQVLAGTGYDSLVDMFEGEGIEMYIDGQVLNSVDAMMYDLYAYVDGEAVSNVYASISSSYDADMDLNGKDIYFALYDPSIEDLDEAERGYAFATIHTDPATGEFVMFDISFGSGEDDADSIYAAIDLGKEGSDEFKYFTVSTMDDSMEFYLIWGEDEDGFNVMVELTDIYEEVELQALYIMPEDGMGRVDIVAAYGAEQYTLGADITVSETGGEWLPEIGETVDIVTIDEDQINKLTMEGMGIAGKLISACSAACEDFAALVSMMM